MIKPGSPGDKALKQLQRDDEYFKNLNKHKNWVGLTVQEVFELLPSSGMKTDVALVFVKAIEDKLRERNCGPI